MITRATRRLPGFRFEVQTPTPTEILPRMDVAVFVGFAASGPLNRPVAVEDIEHFESIFGADVSLAWDNTRGEMIYGYLAPAVRAFFRNGGRRCWIIRVARQTAPPDASPPTAAIAQSNYFPIPGLMQAEFDAKGKLTRVTPAFAQARSEGSWSDSLCVSSALLSTAVVVNAISFAPLQLNLTLNSPDDLAVGDLLRLTFRDEGYQLICTVDSIKTPTPSPLNAGTMVEIAGTKAVWLQASWAKAPASATAQVYTFTHDATSAPIWATVPPPQDTASSPPLPFDWSLSDQNPTVKLDLNEMLAATPAPGSLLRVNFGTDEFWLMAEEFHASKAEGSPPEANVQAVGKGMWRLNGLPSVPPTSRPDGERLTFELWARQGEASRLRLSSLGFEARHSRFWGALPTDLQLYLEPGTLPDTARADLWQAAADPRFPLAGQDKPHVVYFPIAMPIIPDTFLAPDPVSRTALERDGLSQFDATLFLDDKLVEVGVLNLIATADFVRYQSPSPRALCGIHAALGIEEATIIAAPDAIHRGWQETTVEPLPVPFVSPPLPRPAWWRWLDCEPDPNQRAPRAPQGKSFPGAQPSLLAPKLERQDRADEPGALILTWSLLMPADASYVLEEAAQPDYLDATTIYSGSEQKVFIYGRLPGDYYYRVRAVVNGVSSDWSNALVVRVSVGAIPLVSQPVWGKFIDCSIVIIQPPVLTKTDPDPTGTFTLEWTSIPGATYLLQEATTRDFDNAVGSYSGEAERFVVYGRSQGDYYYRVRAVVNGTSSDWSNGVPVRVSPPMRWLLNSTSQYSPKTLLAVQRALLRMCAARGDLFVVLAIPEHYREDDAISHYAALTSRTLDAAGADDDRTFSFGALWHPWLLGREENRPDNFRRTSPDGAACGILARRALVRGAWVAPANELFNGVVALTPSVAPERRLDLQDAHINLIRQEPRGFLVLDADTLSYDDDVRPINVRRLLTLLRRLALKLGATYVFEPNDDSFRRMVTHGFEAMLGELFARGAFAGNTPATSFQVVTDSSVNTPQSIEQGRFIVELRVAPSLPMTFLTIRLVQTGDHTSVTEVR